MPPARECCQYSLPRRRSLIAVKARRALHRSNSSYIVKPFVVLAARTLGPGPLRLRMVKLAHDLTDGGRYADPDLDLDATLGQTSRRAA